MATYADYLAGILPTALRGPWAAAFARALGAACDAALDAAKDAARVGFVLVAPVDALERHLADASLEALPGESTDSQRARVAAVFAFWELAGTLPGLELAAEQLGLAGGVFFRWRDFGTNPPDRRPDLWATWLYRLDPSPFGLDGTWGDPGTWGDGGVWGLDATAADIARIRRLFRAQMGARDRGFIALVLVEGTDFWGPETPWNHGAWSDGSVRTHITFEV